MKKAFLLFLVLVLGVLLGISVPYLSNQLSQRIWTCVSKDWLKARCYEFASQGPEKVAWKKIGEDKWYFEEARFGARYFRLGENLSILIFSPKGYGPAYVFTSEKKILESPDDAVSFDYDWGVIQKLDAQDKRFIKDSKEAFFIKKYWVEIY